MKKFIFVVLMVLGTTMAQAYDYHEQNAINLEWSAELDVQDFMNGMCTAQQLQNGLNWLIPYIEQELSASTIDPAYRSFIDGNLQLALTTSNSIDKLNYLASARYWTSMASVVGMYQTILHRYPDYWGLVYWTDVLMQYRYLGTIEYYLQQAAYQPAGRQ